MKHQASVIHCILTAVAIWATGGLANAAGGTIDVSVIDANAAEIVRASHTFFEQRVPGLISPLVDYGPQTIAPVCDPQHAPVTYAVLVGAGTIGSFFSSTKFELPGPANDVELLSKILRGLGVDAARIHRLVDNGVTRDNLSATLKDVAAAARCGDRVLFQFSGHAVEGKRAFHILVKSRADVDADLWNRFFSNDADVDEVFDRLHSQARRGAGAMSKPPEGWDDIDTLLQGESAFVGYEPRQDHLNVFLGRDVSDFMIAVRNKGAHALALLDTSNIAPSRIDERQREADPQSSWSYQYGVDGPVGGPAMSLIPGHGGYTVFYASGEGEQTTELKLPKDDPNALRYGLFSFAFGSAVLGGTSTTPREIADSVQKFYSSRHRAHPSPIVRSSEPDLVLIAETAPPNTDPIKIISPAPLRGAAAFEKAEIEIEGAVDWTAPVLGVFVGDAEAVLEPGGRFKQTVRLKPGLNVVNIRAVTADNRLHSKTLELLFEGDRKALEGVGRRYAIIIANQDYGPETGMPSLSTPIADADALADILAKEYGFEMQLTLPGGKILPLLLKNAAKREIELALFQLGKVAGAKDTVLIYYAGHGVFEPVTSIAYWVPSDAEQGFEPSYLSAADISAAIQRIQAGSVIMISDSCYSGALMRGGPPKEEKIDEAQRMQALLKLQSRRSRIVITSGNNEPVADAGGHGHSIFARALLDGLEKMDHDAFSARELFDGYILQEVAANADQEPQYRPLEKAGHEGGDFVFVKVPKR